MEWSDDGIVLAATVFGEGGVILDVLTRGQGRHLGLVRGGRSRRLTGVLEPGNLVKLTWRARLNDQLGSFAVEPSESRAGALFDDRIKLAALTSMTATTSSVLHEREPHARLFDALNAILREAAGLDALALAAAAGHYELRLLEDLGFGLDLSACAATGVTEDLTFVSPKSARAVSAEAGAPYRDKLLTLPRFLLDGAAATDWPAVGDALTLTAFFLERQVLMPQKKNLPPARLRFAELVAKESAKR